MFYFNSTMTQNICMVIFGFYYSLFAKVAQVLDIYSIVQRSQRPKCFDSISILICLINQLPVGIGGEGISCYSVL